MRLQRIRAVTDIRGFTGISESLSPEALRDYIDEYLTAIGIGVNSGMVRVGDMGSPASLSARLRAAGSKMWYSGRSTASGSRARRRPLPSMSLWKKRARSSSRGGEALRAYRARQWVHDILRDPPPSDWDGITKFDEK
jgi:class 3 adenylate cyclase